MPLNFNVHRLLSEPELKRKIEQIKSHYMNDISFLYDSHKNGDDFFKYTETVIKQCRKEIDSLLLKQKHIRAKITRDL